MRERSFVSLASGQVGRLREGIAKGDAPALTSMSVMTCHRSIATIQRLSLLRQL